MFDNSFPGYEDVRHAVAHSAEMLNISKKLKSNLMKEDIPYGIVTGRPGVWQGNIVGRRCSTSRYGKEVSYEMSAKSLRLLKEAALEFFAAFPERDEQS